MKRLIRLFCTVAVGCASLWGQATPAINSSPSREFGHAKLVTNLANLTASPNLIEGKELFAPIALAFDLTSNPPILYVADAFNNRVLAWRNPSALQLANQ